MTLPILPDPPSPGCFGLCPQCGAWFALRYLSAKRCKLFGRLRKYRCKKCGKTTEFADRHPREAV